MNLHAFKRDLTYSAHTQDIQRLIELAAGFGAASIRIILKEHDVTVTWACSTNPSPHHPSVQP